MMRTSLFAALGAALVAGAASATAATFSVVDSGGFESPFTTTFNGSGQLEGQVPMTFNGTWLRTKGPGASTAVIQTAMVDSGSQAVRVDRAPNSNDFWGVPVNGYPAERYICIDWSMKVTQTVSPPGVFGPFFGVDSYDDDGGTIARLGTLGVDASTGDVLYIDQDGFLVESQFDAAFDQWYDYRVILDYVLDEASLFFDGSYITTLPFVDAELNPQEFTDANIATFAAGGDAASLAATGTAYFDNFTVIETSINKIPEPATALLMSLGLAGAAFRTRR